MKRSAGIIDAKPSKRIYQSIIADYDVNRSICELIDNALDAWTRNGRKKALNIDIDFDLDQQSIRTRDTAGGVREEDLRFVIAPGHTGTKPDDQTIGFFGVGTKRAVVALAEDISIRSRHQEEKTFLVEFDDDWIREEDDWEVESFEVDPIDPGSTQISLSRLRRKIEKEHVDILAEHVATTYAFFLNDPKVAIKIDGVAIAPKRFENWAYPPKHPPTELSGHIDAPDGRKVQVTMLGGLTLESSPATGEYGVYIYCNGRLIARALKTPEIGYMKGFAGLAHPKVAITRVIISLQGDARDMPWNSSKSAINLGNPVFAALRERLFAILKYYASLARGWMGDWDNKVFKYAKGTIRKEKATDFRSAAKLKLPPLPKLKPRFADIVMAKNHALIKRCPWTEGLRDGVIATDLLYKAHLAQKNRIALIVLDSTLEIAFKDYLVHVKKIGRDKFRKIIDYRTEVIKEVRLSTQVSEEDWGQLEYYYKLRCDLIHEKASAVIPDKDIVNYRALVERTLNQLHGLQF